MSNFPFLLPKNLALYLRMTSIIEGIYKTHQIQFQFVNMMKQVLAEENLMYGAYANEIKTSVNDFIKSARDAVSLAPEMKKLLDETRQMKYMKKRTTAATIPVSVMSGAGFVGSTILYGADQMLGAAGMVISLVIFAVSFAKKRTAY